ncbi:uncharacterized protein METZ01_LOCUS72359 [marine metagenome]|uniref:Uncharacterized protein n=1 Tax=marine metagenome TaxID=408172 RepID=A0A381TTY3_9ZZZZ
MAENVSLSKQTELTGTTRSKLKPEACQHLPQFSIDMIRHHPRCTAIFGAATLRRSRREIPSLTIRQCNLVIASLARPWRNYLTSSTTRF